MSITNPAEGQRDWGLLEGAVRLPGSDTARQTRADLIDTVRAALTDLEGTDDMTAVGDLLRTSARLADLVVATARDEGATWQAITDGMREPLADVYARFSGVHSGRPATPRDEADDAVDADMLGYSLSLIGRAESRAERDEAIQSARRDGATYEQLAEASGLSRAMLDRIVNARTY